MPIENDSPPLQGVLMICFSNTKCYDSNNTRQTALRSPKDFLPANAIYEVYPITQKNYREVIKARSLETYKAFFEAVYK